MIQNNEPDRAQNQPDGARRPDTANDGPVQTRDSDHGAEPDRQIAQQKQQSTGVGSGQT